MNDELLDFGRQLLIAKDGLRWPEERLQIQYTGTSGERLLAQAVDFLHLLETFVPSLRSHAWAGLDYGAGWGRMASLMTHYGQPQQLDCVDAWQKSIDIARDCGLQNSLKLVSPQILPGELPENAYDFAYAYSIFTHLPASHIINNTMKIMASLKPGGVFLFTVRAPAFVEFLKKNDKYKPEIEALETEGYWFGNAQSQDYGDTIVSERWLVESLGSMGHLERIGPMKYESTQIAIRLTKAK